MLKLPEMPGKHHMIGYKPVIAEANKRYVHHMMLYECHDEVRLRTFKNRCSVSYWDVWNSDVLLAWRLVDVQDL